MLFKRGDEDTICALSTPPGVGGIAVIRVSGRRALLNSRLICKFLPENPESHRLYFGTANGVSEEADLDEVLAAFFQEGRSFTGEETVEISCHGGKVISEIVLRELVRAGCRLAGPGEFTYRAFMNGRIDLVQAESVLGLIESRSQQAARMALRQLKGDLSEHYSRLEDSIVWMLAHLEASIDFSETDVEVVSSPVLAGRAEETLKRVEELLSGYQKGRLVNTGLRIALIGRPNVGKSSLLNRLLREDRAIVTARPGTTRDVVEGILDVDGVPVTVCDTAGLRETSDEVEVLGIERSLKAAEEADLVLFVGDIKSTELDEELRELSKFQGSKLAVVINKVDTDPEFEIRSDKGLEIQVEELARTCGAQRIFWVSATNGHGIETVREYLKELVHIDLSTVSNLVSSSRHYDLLQRIHSCLLKAIELIKGDSSPEFVAFELQESVLAIHELLGKRFDDQVMDRVFKEFCIGK